MYRFHLEFYQNQSHKGFVDYITLDYEFWSVVLDSTLDEDTLLTFAQTYNIPIDLLQVLYNHSGYDGEIYTENGEYHSIENTPYFSAKDVLALIQLLIINVFDRLKLVEAIDKQTNNQINNRLFFVEKDNEYVTFPYLADSYWDTIKWKYVNTFSVFPVTWENGEKVKGEKVEISMIEQTTFYQKNKIYFDTIIAICEDCVDKNYWFQGGYHS